ncbi:MAG: hypothetical protein ACREKH_05715, partial [Candidatus Rokuibacteriota bacterium]
TPSTAEAPQPPPAVATAPAPEKAGAMQDAGRVVDAIASRVNIGAYGSMRYEASNLDEAHSTFTFRRFVLTADANIAPRLKAAMELEFERFRELELEKAQEPAEGGLTVEQTVEGTNESEIALEQAWLQYDFTDWIGLRAGGVLVPLGRFNLNHDDNEWDLPRRSLVDRGSPVLPSTAAWSELGAGLLGKVDVGRESSLDYQVYVVNGVALDVEFEQIIQTRSPEPAKQVIEAKVEPKTGTFSSDVKEGKAVTGRLAFSPALGHEVAGSWYWGQYTPDFLDHEDVYSLGFDGKTGIGPFEFEGQYIFTHFDGIEGVARSLARIARDSEAEFENPDLETEIEFELSGLARNKQGYWIDGRYRFWPAFLSDTFLGSRFDNPQLVAILRGEQVWFDDMIQEAAFGGGTLTEFETEDRFVNRITTGLAYRPVPLVVFQLAYELTQTNNGKSLAGVTNFLPAGENEDTSHAILVGAAFGF